jgi:hypothetical protein
MLLMLGYVDRSLHADMQLVALALIIVVLIFWRPLAAGGLKCGSNTS